MVKIAAITSGWDVPSSRFRVRQYIERFARRGHRVTEYAPLIDKYAAPRLPDPEDAASRFAQRVVFGGLRAVKLVTRLPGIVGSRVADATWLEREMIPQAFTLERYLSRPLVFDVDDAIWAGSDRAASAARRIAERADCVVAGNTYIAEWFGAHARRVQIVPTALDTEQFMPATRRRDGRFRVVWTGLAYNLPYLYAIEQTLNGFLRERDAELAIVAESPPHFRTLPADRVIFIPWSPASEAEALRTADVGVMPLPDDEWTRGKCSLKMIQYMATALPVVVSPVGMNRDVLSIAEVGFGARTDGEWRDALDALWNDEQMRRRFGAAGRAIAVNQFSSDVVFQVLANVFESVV